MTTAVAITLPKGIHLVVEVMDSYIASAALPACEKVGRLECFACVCEAVAKHRVAWLLCYVQDHDLPKSTADNEAFTDAFFDAWGDYCLGAVAKIIQFPCSKTAIKVPADTHVH